MAILIAGCVLETKYINDAFIFLEERLINFKQEIKDVNEEDIDSDENILYIENLHEEWHKKLPGLKSLIWHSGVKDIEVSLSRIASYLREKEKTETMAELNALIDYLDHYSEDFTILIENIL